MSIRGKRVQVVLYRGNNTFVKVGMCGYIRQARCPSTYQFPIEVAFKIGNRTYTELFAVFELRYLNNKPVRIV